MKVTDAVKKVVDENILYQILLSSGLANLNALSRQIKNIVDSLSNENVKLNTIEKALTKLASKTAAIEDISTRDTNVSLESGVIEKVYDIKSLNELNFSNVLLAIIDEGKVKAVIKGEDHGSEQGMVLLKVSFSGSVKNIPYHPLIMMFNTMGINIIHAFRFDRNIYFFMSRPDSIKALSVVEKLR
ncbi:MAG: hypothetical protein QXV38_02620 [Conexivisphaerales archaeon]